MKFSRSMLSVSCAAVVMAFGGFVTSAHALFVVNETQSTVLFDSSGFEFDTANGPATHAGPGFWSNGNVAQDRVVSGIGPGAFEGNNFLATTRDGSGAGNPRAFAGPVQTTVNDTIHAEWSMYLNNPSDTGFFFTNDAGTNIGQVRIGGNGTGTVQDSFNTGNISSNAYQTNNWQRWELDYTIGQSNYTVKVNDSTVLNGQIAGGVGNSTGFEHISFFHNGNQTYYLDTTANAPVDPYAPQDQASLQQMIDINWRLGPRTPKGLQDSGAGIAHDSLISVGGYQNTSGFHDETWALNLSASNATWQTLPSYPGSNNPTNVSGAGRQGIMTTVVNDEVYAWGGFNYTAPATYADGYKLSKTGNVWAWAQVASLPTQRTSAGSLVSVGDNIYVVGGGDYDLTQVYTQTDRTGTIAGFGKKLFGFDTTSPTATWQELPEMPGTARYVHATAVVGDKIYVIGGATGAHPSTSTVVDNWVFDTTTQEWSRIRDLPVASGNFPGGQIVVEDRYILLIGGYQYGQIENPDGTTRQVYGTPTSVSNSGVYSDIWVYDTETDLFGLASSLPVSNNLPTAVYEDGVLHLIGGELDGTQTALGEEFAHHPDLYLIGDVTVVPEPGAIAIMVGGLNLLILKRRR